MFKVRCPYSECGHTFEVASELSWRAGICPKCNRAITLREAEVLARVEQLQAKRVAAGAHMGATASAAETDLSGAKPETGLLSALVEDVRSLWNVGSIFRTADGAGFSKLYLCGITGCPPRKEIAKTSLGAENSVLWQSYVSALDVLPELRSCQVTIIGLERNETSASLSDFLGCHKITKPICLLLGNEVTGLSAESLSHCDHVLHLPMRGLKESLNVSVAFGIAAYAIAEAIAP